jgi:PAS domain S-box-containing protein
MFRNATVGVYRTTPDGQILYVNKALMKMLGFKSLKEIRGRNLNAKGYEPQYSREDFMQRIDKEGVVSGLESAWKKKDGALFFVRESAHAVRAEDGKVIYFEGTIEDLTEGKLAQERIVRLNQLLRALSNIDQLILRNSTPGVMFDEACKILVKDGKYLSVWIGVLDESGTVIHPIAWNGIEDGYLKEAGVIGGPKPEKRSLIREAIRTGLACTCDDAWNDPSYELWRGDARRLGYRSAGAFPIRVSGKVVGIVNAFADKPNRFTSEEIHLLSELADDIGFALWTTEVRAKDKTANDAIKDREFWLTESQRVARIGSYVMDVRSGNWTSSIMLDEILGISSTFRHDMDGFLTLAHPEQRERIAEYLKQVVSEKKSFNLEYRIVRPADGAERWMWVRGELLFGTSGEPVSMFGTIQDITDRKRAEESERREHILLKTIIDNLPCAVFVKDKEYRKTIVNPLHVQRVAEHVGSLGLNLEKDMIGKTDFEIYPRELAEKFFASDQRVIRDGESVLNALETGINADGHKSWLLVSKVPLRGENGEITGLVGITTEITDQKEAEEAQKRERILLRTLIDSLPNSVYVKDREGRARVMNLAAVRTTSAQSEEEVIGKTDFELWPKEIAEKSFAEDQELMERGVPVVDNEERVGGYDRKEQWRLTTKLPLRDENGAVVGLVGIGTDITELKRIESQLRESEERFRAIFENASVGIYRTTPDGRVLLANPAMIKILGFQSFDELARCNLEEEGHFFADQPRAKFRELVETKGSITGVESKKKRRDGSTFWVRESSSASYDEKGKVVYYEGTVEDITEHKRVEEALENERSLLRTLIEHLPNAVFVKDREYRKILTNRSHEVGVRSYLKQHGFADDKKILGLTDFEVYPKEIAEQYFSEDSKVIETGKAVLNREELHVDADGQRHWTLISKVPLRGEEGTINGLVGITTDITSQKLAGEALRRSEETLKQITNSIDDAIYSVDGETAEFAYLSPVFERKLGYSLSDIKEMGGRWAFLKRTVQSGDFSEVDPVVGELREHVVRNVPILENWWRCKDGRLLYLEDKSVPVYEDGKLVRIDGVLRDITEWRLSEDAKQREQILLRTLIDNIPYPVYVKDTECRKIIANPADVHNLGCRSEAEVIGKTDFDFYPKEIADKFFLNDQSVIKDGRTILNKEEYFYDPEGRKRWLLTTKIPLVDQSGNLTGLVGIGADITERKAVDEALRKSEEELRALFESMKDIIIVLDKDGRVLRFGPNDDLSLYKPAREIVGKRSYEIFPKELSDLFLSVIHKTIEKGQMQSVEYAIDIHGVQRWRLASVSPLTNDSVLWVARDITELKLMEREIKDSEKKYRELVENALVGVYRATMDGRIIYANGAMAEMLEYGSPQDLLSVELFDLYKNDDERASFVQQLRQHGKTDKSNEVEFLTKTGQVRNILLSASLGGEIISGMAKDITEIRKLERQFAQTQRLEGLGNIAAGIAHDFNNILGVILGYADLLAQSTFDPRKFERGTHAIVKSAERGKSLVRQLLTFARKTETTFRSVRVNEIVSEIEKLIGETFPKTIVATTELKEDLPVISGDANQIHQVLLNICLNARDAMPKGGELTISTDVTALDALLPRFPEATARKYVEILVRDSGTGMDEETRRRVFEPFFTTKEVGKGTGLGLSVVYGIMQSHRGFVDVVSEPGKGTVFTVYFPVFEDWVEETGQDEEATEEIPLGTETVLIVEDEDMLRDLLRGMLESKGYRVLEARDGQEAVETFRDMKNQIAVVLSDLGLPRLSGEEVASFIKQVTPEAKIIIASGFIDPEVRSGLEATGVKDFIQKPYKAREVLKIVRLILDRGES